MKMKVPKSIPQRLILAMLLALVVLPGVSAAGSSEEATASTPAAATAEPGSYPGIAVVELFTSEGCSSCPPADKTLSSIASESRRTGSQVFSIAWHVDYWDYLGWKDPYDSKVATDRQRGYARIFSSELYTPEIVVNGKTVASYAGDTGEVDRIVRANLAQPVKTGVELILRSGPTPGSIRVGVTLTGAPRSGVVGLALVEDDLVQRPTSGENAGRTLHHSSVLRSYTTLPPAEGSAEITLPAGLALRRSRLVALVQNVSTREIVGANSADLAVLDTASAAGNHADAASSTAAVISGSLVGANGTGVDGALVQVCSDTLCIPGRSNKAGHYLLKDIPAGEYTVKIFLPGQTAEPAAARPVAVNPGDYVFLPAFSVRT